ncbi:TetR/AcrR family transcriptional regulator [Psychrobium sp. 1_MG-2023]|uniref:acrylate utilization transcriptional regulator AcuR n=1 Tax=Psychrobium sp. 1_MG-2023 TaxID=3062624 RepID=UPI00273564F3|nr:TetR/AcrR family transcriptional regulator [Psychrobium sp. 1_MG-2023]MDP2559969.1 TetR/AcrR family transcriptional regulator [Psychrobium sp. 1_MG-2023]
MNNKRTNQQATVRRGRPPKQPHRDTRTELIRQGLIMVTELGFVASGVEKILKQAKVPKGSFYYYFDSKEAFGLAVIDNYHSYFSNKLSKHLLQQEALPLQRIENFVLDAQQGMAKYQFRRGCLIGTLGQEVDALPLSYRARLIDVFIAWQQQLTECLEEAKSAGQLAKTADCAALAELFWIGWEGAVSRAKLVQSEQPLQRFLNHFIAGLPR